LKTWVDLGAKKSTSNPGVGTVLTAKRHVAIAPSYAHGRADRSRRRAAEGQLELFRALPGDLAPRDAQDLMAYPFFSLSKTPRVKPIDFRMGGTTIRVEATADHGMATIWDADVLIWAASQIVEARDAGLRTSRLMAATPYEILSFVRRGCPRLPSFEGRPRPSSVHDHRDFHPPGCRAAAASFLLDQRMEGACRHARTSAQSRTHCARLVLYGRPR
jgi:Replication initiator protein A